MDGTRNIERGNGRGTARDQCKAIERRLFSGRAIASRIRQIMLVATDAEIVEALAGAGVSACERLIALEHAYHAAVANYHQATIEIERQRRTIIALRRELLAARSKVAA